SALMMLSIVLVALGLAPYGVRHLHQNGIAAALFSGVMFGLASLYTKAMTDYYLLNAAPSSASRILSNPYVYVTILTNVAGLIALQNSFASARGIIVMPLSTALSNIIPIAGAIAVFGEHLPANPVAASIRLTAFGLTILGGALLTNPVEDLASPEGSRAAQINSQLRTPVPESAGK
ncbi:MAG TPA: hypothetical protein VHY56_07595, partial [Candidatus Binataceae bacterium]|nr:hypothetical protein [Candidatus Binataceae bacterium]